MEHNAIHLIYKKIVGFTFSKWLWWALKLNIYHIGTALSGDTPAFTSFCVEVAVLLHHCGCQIFTLRAEVFKGASAGAEYQWLLFERGFELSIVSISLAFAVSTQSRLTGPMTCSPDEHACFSGNILTCERAYFKYFQEAKMTNLDVGWLACDRDSLLQVSSSSSGCKGCASGEQTISCRYGND